MVTNPNFLVFVGMADAYAAACEYLKLPAEQDTLERALEFKEYVQHPRHGIELGSYTDDTEMSVANARVLCTCTPPYRMEYFANEYVDEFNRGGRRDGYSRGFQKILETVKNGKQLMAAVGGESTGNGACMRAIPIGFLPKPATVLATATIQARVTHNTPDGRFSARAVALLAHLAIYRDAKIKFLLDECLNMLPEEDQVFVPEIRKPWPADQRIGVKNQPTSIAVQTIRAVWHVLRTETTYMGMLETILRIGGDTDSVAAIAWGIASFRDSGQVPHFMPFQLDVNRAQNRIVRGENYLRKIGHELVRKFCS